MTLQWIWHPRTCYTNTHFVLIETQQTSSTDWQVAVWVHLSGCNIVMGRAKPRACPRGGRRCACGTRAVLQRRGLRKCQQECAAYKPAARNPRGLGVARGRVWAGRGASSARRSGIRPGGAFLTARTCAAPGLKTRTSSQKAGPMAMRGPHRRGFRTTAAHNGSASMCTRRSIIPTPMRSPTRGRHAKHRESKWELMFGGLFAIEAGALPGMNKYVYRTTAGG